MKILINVADERYKWIKEHKGKTDFSTTEMLYSRVRRGTPIPDALYPLIAKLIEDAKEESEEQDTK